MLLLVCTGGGGEVVMLAAGGTVSMTKAGPLGAPLKTFPGKSWADAATATAPDGVVDVTANTVCQVLAAMLVRLSRTGETLPEGCKVKEGVAARASLEVREIVNGPTVTGEAWP
jgi:hypothetical protein